MLLFLFVRNVKNYNRIFLCNYMSLSIHLSIYKSNYWSNFPCMYEIIINVKDKNVKLMRCS